MRTVFRCIVVLVVFAVSFSADHGKCPAFYLLHREK